MKDLKNIFEAALQAFIKNHDKNDDDLYEALLYQIVDENLATDIFLFFPVSMNRLIFRKHNVEFPDCYFQYNEDEQLIGEKKFSENDMYNLIDSFSKEVIHRNLSKEDFFAIVKRSSEFNAINNALKDNANLESLKIMPMKIYI